MEDIMRLAGCEAMLFKYGSGTGTDLSTLRSSREKLSGGGTPSGPLSFMRVFDQIAAVIKSGGKTRRAAKMQSLKVTHPDIERFIACKMQEEKKAWALIEQGYDGGFGGEAYESVMFQNANTSVRVTDEFMDAVENDDSFETRAVKTGESVETLKARDIMQEIAEGTHVCGDPGVQYDTTINKWHTCKNSGPINASNPCSEFMFIDDSACNLASVNLMKFVDESGYFDVDLFQHVVRLFIVAQDIIVDGASYPTQKIAENSHRFRPLGLGYANLGAVIMRMGLPYDSDEGRALAGSITALMTGAAYSASQEMASAKGAFEEYEKNKEPMHEVIKMHHQALEDIDSGLCPPYLLRTGKEVWDQILESGEQTGFRNSQVTLLAPTGTIGFVMDCDTTGVEPDIALIKYKQLAGGGMLKIVNKTVRPALSRLGYTDDQIEAMIKHIDENETIEGAPHVKDEHLEVFDCAFKPRNGKRYIEYKAHLRMMAAVQPFLSGAISKTVNMPNDASINDIMQTYLDGWKMGLKSVAIYRDGSKKTQPMNLSSQRKEVVAESQPAPAPLRRRLPLTRQSITHKFEVAGHEGYLTVGMYEDGGPGEVFITMAKEGSTVGGTMDAFGTAISLCLQYGVPVQELCQKFAHSRFEPSGFTKNPDIPIAKSIVDYIFRWLDTTFPGGKADRVLPPVREEETGSTEDSSEAGTGTMTAAMIEQEQKRVDEQFEHFMEDAPTCDVCGAITVRNGACYRCYNCGNSMGCS
jgi:ribonucleoside-diphosphate reductase alpha chain